MKNEDIILRYRDLFGNQGTADQVLGSILEGLGSDKRTAEMAASAISEIGPVTDDVIPALINNLYHDERASQAIRSALRGMGDPALQQLVSRLPSAQVPLRYLLIKAIGEFGPAARSAAPHLQLVFNSTDPIDRLYAVMALASIEGFRAELCIDIAKAFSGRPYTENEVEFAVRCLSEMGLSAAEALPIIVLGLIRLDDLLASGPAFVLSKIGSPAVLAIPALLQRSEQCAATSLERIIADVDHRGELNESLRMALAIQDRAARIQASCFAVVQSTPSLKILGDWLDHHDLHMRLGSIATLGSFGTAAVPMLQQLRPFFDSDHPEERMHAAVASWQIGAPEPKYERIAILALEESNAAASTIEWVKRVFSSQR